MKLITPVGLRAVIVAAAISLAAFASMASTTATTEARVLSDFWVQVLCDSPSSRGSASVNCDSAGRNYQCERIWPGWTWSCRVN